MLPFETLLLLILAASGLSVLGRWLPWPRPITWVLGGVALSLVPPYLRSLGVGWVPVFPKVVLDPHVFFLCVLPPLLFADGWLMPLRDFRAAARPILLASIGLVVFTTLIVGLIAHWLIPDLPLAMAFALGAVISPTDAVAVSAITERLRVPARLATILNGESLMNDATGLVAFKFALGATLAGGFSLRDAGREFFLLAAGGFALGLAVGWLFGKVRDHLDCVTGAETQVQVTLSLMTPFAAYLAGEALEVSSVLAIVAAGLYSGWRDPLRQDVATRQDAWAVWSLVVFWLNGAVFLLLGLQFPALIEGVRSNHGAAELLFYTAAVSGVAMLARLVWFFPAAYLPFVVSRRVRESEKPPAWQAVLVGGWAGMRGAVTLAAALSIPLALDNGEPWPARDLVIFLAFGVILVTLLVQGTSLEWLIQWLGVREDGTREQEEHRARKAAVQAGLDRLQSERWPGMTEAARGALEHVIVEYQHRLAQLDATGEPHTASDSHVEAERSFRLAALEAERTTVNTLWRTGAINDEVLRPLQADLDHEETALRGTGSTA